MIEQETQHTDSEPISWKKGGKEVRENSTLNNTRF